MDAPTTPYEMIGGSAVVMAIVDRFYRLMEDEAAYAELRALHAEDLTQVRAGLAAFLNGWLGGPRDWFDRGACVMSLHRPIRISQEAARQWAEAMTRAIADQSGLDERLSTAMAERLVMMAEGMVNVAETAPLDPVS